jgi:hypothetical protein
VTRVLIAAVFFLVAAGCDSPAPDCLEGPAEPVDCPGERRPEGDFLQVPSATHPLVIHHLSDAPGDHVAAMLAQAERAFDLNIEWGMPALPPDSRGPDDAYDIYLVPGDELFGFSKRDDRAPTDGGCATFSSVNTGVDELSEFSVLHHEIRHGFQHAVWCASGWVHESDAAFAMDYAQPDLSLAHNTYVSTFQASPEEGLFGGRTWDEAPPYGVLLFHRYLSERFGDGSPPSSGRLSSSSPPGPTSWRPGRCGCWSRGRRSSRRCASSGGGAG